MLDTDANAPISVSVLPTFPDSLRFAYRALFWRMRFVVVFAVLLLSAFLSAPLLPFSGETTVAARYMQLLPALILPVLVFVFIPVTSYLAARKQWRTVAALREPRTYTFTNAGIQVAGETFDGFIAWSNIFSAKRVGEHVLLATGQQQFYLIPVRAFGPEENWTQFCRLVATKVSDCRLSDRRRASRSN
jgi:hypothetical protein